MNRPLVGRAFFRVHLGNPLIPVQFSAFILMYRPGRDLWLILKAVRNDVLIRIARKLRNAHPHQRGQNRLVGEDLLGVPVQRRLISGIIQRIADAGL